MNMRKTTSRSYLSKYGGGYIQPHQWVTEKLCAKIAARDGVELPDRFWILPKWSAIFRIQARLASNLIFTYSDIALSKALDDKRVGVWSFQAFNMIPKFTKVLEEYQNKIDMEEHEWQKQKKKRPLKTPEQ